MSNTNYPAVILNDCTAQVYQIDKKGDLQNAYTPLQNLLTNDDIGDFTTSNLRLNAETPVDIITVDEFDGSVNLILNDDVNEPRLVNTRMSIQENKTFEIPQHAGKTVNNVYDDQSLDMDISLLKQYKHIPKLNFQGLLEGGAMPCGTYTFYFKYADSYGNLTNIVQESGTIMIHIGPINSTKVRMGLSNEVSDKQIQFVLENIDSTFDYVRVFFERRSSGADGAITPTYCMVDQNFPIIGNKSEIIITGQETIFNISQSDLIGELADITAVKTQKILHDVLFLGNVQANDYDYNALQQLAWKIIPREISTTNSELLVGGLTGNYDQITTNGSNPGIYYNHLNQYYYTGYWPDEYYRFGVVFIFNNNTTSPVFNIQGIDFNLLKDDNGEILDTSTEEGFAKLFNLYIPEDGREPHSVEPDDYIFNKEYMTNSKGVIKFRNRSIFSGTYDTFTPNTYGIQFDLTKIGCKETVSIDSENHQLTPVETLLKYKIKGFYFVRQKRIPSILAQGIVIGLTDKDRGCIPVLQNNDGIWSTKSFLSKDRLLLHTGSDVEIPTHVVSTKALLVPDFELNSPVFNAIFTSNTFALTKIANIQFASDNNTIIPKQIEANYDNEYVLSKLTAVNQGCKLTTDGENYFSTIAGVPEEPYKTSDVVYIWDKTPPQDLTTSSSQIRGNWGAYVGMSCDSFSYGDVVNIKQDDVISNPNYNLLEFKKRFADYNSYSAISPRYNYNDGNDFTCYNGDCFTSMFTHRMMSNFIDPELPTNSKIVDPSCWAKNYAVRCTAEILTSAHSNLTSDSEGWYVPAPPSEKSDVISLIFSILSGNVEMLFTTISNWGEEKKSEQDLYANEIANAFEIYIGANNESDQSTYQASLYQDLNDYADVVSKGYIKKVNPKEQEANSSGINLKALFKSDDKWELHGLSQINRADVNAVSFGQWITFPICSSFNLAYRDIDFSNATEEARFNKKRTFYPLAEKDQTCPLFESQVINAACKCSISSLGKSAYRTVPFIKQEFFNRIYWSKPNVSDEFMNSYRLIFSTQYQEYNKEFGAITKIESLGNNLVVIFEHGIGLLPVDISKKTTSDYTAYLPSQKILPAQIQILTSDYGSMWKDSVLKIQDKEIIVGVDTIAKKIWMLSNNGLEFISDHVITKFLNSFIDLSEYDHTVYQGHINVKTHYNSFKQDVMFTYYKDEPKKDEFGKIIYDDNGCVKNWIAGTCWNICYNLTTKKFITFYDWCPLESCNIDNIYFSFNKFDRDSVLSKSNKFSKVTYKKLLDGTSYDKEVYFTWTSKSLIDPQFVEKCKEYYVTSENCKVRLTLKDKNSYLCYYLGTVSEDSDGKKYINWKFEYSKIKQSGDLFIVSKDQLDKSNGCVRIADLKVVKLQGITTMEEESGVFNLYNLRNSTPNRMYLWKHGQAGLYDNQGKIKPTHWYGNQHEFNFEFVVNDTPTQQKVFNNLKLLANKTAPAKFEYEVVGEGYEWFEYKPIVEWINKQVVPEGESENYWWLQVLGKKSGDVEDMYLDFPGLFDRERTIHKLPYLKMKHTDKKGTPERPHYTWDGGTDYWKVNINDQGKPVYNKTDNQYEYNCSEPCLVGDDQLNEVRFRTESLSNDMKKYGRIRGNMQYLEDLWNVEIRPIQMTWCYKENDELKFKKLPETRHRDKYIKIKIRYSGEDLALVQAIITTFNESYA